MDTVIERAPMPKPKGRPKRSERDDVAVKVDRRLVSRAKVVAGHRGIAVAELISELLESPLDKAYAAMVKELDAKG
jgi:hypothetical protein